MENLVRKDNPKLAAFVGTLKSRPPINFQVVMKVHARQNGLEIEKLEYNGPKFGMQIRTPSIQHVRAFAHSLPRKFPQIVTTAEVVESKYVSAAPPLKYANPMRKSPYLRI